MIWHGCAGELGVIKPIVVGHSMGLGHSSVATTGRYLQTNLAMKQEVLIRFWKRAGLESGQPKRWRPTQGLLAYLESL